MRFLIGAAVLGLIYWLWFGGDDVWSGYVYPDASDLMVDRFAGEFSTLEDCRQAALGMIESNGWYNADYECGLNCEPFSPGSDLYVCEETSR